MRDLARVHKPTSAEGFVSNFMKKYGISEGLRDDLVKIVEKEINTRQPDWSKATTEQLFTIVYCDDDCPPDHRRAAYNELKRRERSDDQ